MKTHQINYEDVKNFPFSHQIVGHLGKGFHKCICAIIHDNSVSFNVYLSPLLLLSGATLEQAVEKYNSI